MTLKIELKNDTVTEHLMYFLNSLPKKDISIEVEDDQLMSKANKKQYQKALKALQKGEAIDSQKARELLGV